MEIKLDSEAAAQIASAAIFQTLSTEARESVVTQAIKQLLEPTKDSYTRGKTNLQLAFDSAIQQAAYRVVLERVANDPEIAQQINNLLGPLIQGVLSEQVSEGRYGLGLAIGKAIGNWLNEQASK